MSGEIVQVLVIHWSLCKHDSMIEELPLLEMVIVWIKGFEVELVEALMDLSAQQVLPTNSVF